MLGVLYVPNTSVPNPNKDNPAQYDAYLLTPAQKQALNAAIDKTRNNTYLGSTNPTLKLEDLMKTPYNPSGGFGYLDNPIDDLNALANPTNTTAVASTNPTSPVQPLQPSQPLTTTTTVYTNPLSNPFSV